jgi:prevent-host-death family protein
VPVGTGWDHVTRHPGIVDMWEDGHLNMTSVVMRTQRYISIAEARTRLSELVEKAASGEEIVIARDNKPVAKLVPVRTHAPRVPGSAKGQVWIAPDFDEIPDDVHDYTR